MTTHPSPLSSVRADHILRMVSPLLTSPALLLALALACGAVPAAAPVPTLQFAPSAPPRLPRPRALRGGAATCVPAPGDSGPEAEHVPLPTGGSDSDDAEARRRPEQPWQTHDLSTFEAMLKDAPADADVWGAYGHALLSGRGDHAGAMQAYRRAIELSPSHSFALNNLGYILMKHRGDLAGAEGCFRKALQVVPADVNTNVNLAVLLSGTFSCAAARPCLQVRASAVCAPLRRLARAARYMFDMRPGALRPSRAFLLPPPPPLRLPPGPQHTASRQTMTLPPSATSARLQVEHRDADLHLYAFVAGQCSRLSPHAAVPRRFLCPPRQLGSPGPLLHSSLPLSPLLRPPPPCLSSAPSVDDSHLGVLVNYANFLVERPLPSLDAEAAKAAAAAGATNHSGGEDLQASALRALRKAAREEGGGAEWPDGPVLRERLKEEGGGGGYTWEELTQEVPRIEEKAAETAITYWIAKVQDWKAANFYYERALEVAAPGERQGGRQGRGD